MVAAGRYVRPGTQTLGRGFVWAETTGCSAETVVLEVSPPTLHHVRKAHAPYGTPRATAGAASLQAWVRASCVGLKSVYLKEEIVRRDNMEIL